MAAFVVLQGGPAFAQTGTNQCQHHYTAGDYRAVAVRIYHQPNRVRPHQLYKLLHLRVCATNDQARAAMNKTTLNQRTWRIARRARAERECGTPACNRELGRWMTNRRYDDPNAFGCIDAIVNGESGWSHDINYGGRHGPPSGVAYGIPQALPPGKMASAGADWATNPATQIRWMFGYVDARYGGPCQAAAYKASHGTY